MSRTPSNDTGETADQVTFGLAEAVAETIREPLLILDSGLRVILANRSFCVAFKLEAGETFQRSLYEIGNAQWDIPDLRKLLQQVQKQNRPVSEFELTHVFPGLGRKVLSLSARRLLLCGDQPELILLAIQDITCQRNSVNDSFAAAAFRISSEALIGLSADGIILRWNPTAERVFGYSEQEIVGSPVSILARPGFDVEQQDLLRRLRTGEKVVLETVRVTKAGQQVAVLFKGEPVLDRSGNLAGFSVELADISERNQMDHAVRDREQDCAQLVREKDVLVQDIHHRVKNNLQTIASLLALHAGHSDDPEVVRALSKAESRVQAIARLHERLYASANLAEVQFGEYLRHLIDDIRLLHGRPGVTFLITSEDVVVDMEKAVPLALIANELIGNCLQHAFPSGRGGEISISLTYVRDSVAEGEPLDNASVRLLIQDNGAGFPPDLDTVHSNSMGLRLVRLLCRQLQADCELLTLNGARCVITFSLAEPPATDDIAVPARKSNGPTTPAGPAQ